MPGWVYLTLLIHLLVFLIVAAVTRKTMRAAVPMCDEHRNHWLFRTLGIVGGLLLIIVGIVGLAVAVTGPGSNPDVGLILGLSAVGAFFLWIVAAIIASVTAIRPTLIDDRGMRLTGVSEGFVSAYEEQVREHRTRLPDLDRDASERWGERRPRRRDDDDYDDRGYRRDEDDRRDREDRGGRDDRRRGRDEDY